MKKYYLATVGHGVTPLMSIAPNPDGLIDEDTVKKLHAFKAWVDALNASDLARGPGVKASGTAQRGNDARYAADKAVDGDNETYFAADDGATTAVIELSFDTPKKVNGFILREPIALGQRVTGYTIECRVAGQWKPVATGKTIGYKRIILEGHALTDNLKFKEGDINVNAMVKAKGRKAVAPKVKVQFPVTDGVRLNIDQAQACPLISTFQVIGEVMPNKASVNSEEKRRSPP
jgi:alpha-L-fucosidase